MYKTIKEACEIGKAMGYDIIMEMNGMYGAAKWSEKKYIEDCGGAFVGTIFTLMNENN